MAEHRIAVEMSFNTDTDATDDDFEAFVDEVVRQFDAIGFEVNVVASLAHRTAEFAASIEEESFELAAAGFLVKVRTALHAAGCATAGWPRFVASDQVVRALQGA